MLIGTSSSHGYIFTDIANHLYFWYSKLGILSQFLPMTWQNLTGLCKKLFQCDHKNIESFMLEKVQPQI